MSAKDCFRCKYHTDFWYECEDGEIYDDGCICDCPEETEHHCYKNSDDNNNECPYFKEE